MEDMSDTEQEGGMGAAGRESAEEPGN